MHLVTYKNTTNYLNETPIGRLTLQPNLTILSSVIFVFIMVMHGSNNLVALNFFRSLIWQIDHFCILQKLIFALGINGFTCRNFFFLRFSASLIRTFSLSSLRLAVKIQFKHHSDVKTFQNRCLSFTTTSCSTIVDCCIKKCKD